VAILNEFEKQPQSPTMPQILLILSLSIIILLQARSELANITLREELNLSI